MVDQLNSFASEVTRVAREVGTEGKLGGQADVHGVAGTWKDLTDSVNSMAGNLTGAGARNIAAVTTAVANGDLSKKITVDVQGEILELKTRSTRWWISSAPSRGSDARGARGGYRRQTRRSGEREGCRGHVEGPDGQRELMAGNLTGQVRNIAAVTTAVANGDLSKKITVDVQGEILELKNTINTMVDQLRSFAAEVTRVAREVGTEGKLGGQADVRMALPVRGKISPIT
jgi:HAMP domain-containing protein